MANHADIEAAVLAVEVLGRGGLPQRTDQVHVGVRSQRGVFVGDAEPGEARTNAGASWSTNPAGGNPKFVYVVWAESGVPQELRGQARPTKIPLGSNDSSQVCVARNAWMLFLLLR